MLNLEKLKINKGMKYFRGCSQYLVLCLEKHIDWKIPNTEFSRETLMYFEVSRSYVTLQGDDLLPYSFCNKLHSP